MNILLVMPNLHVSGLGYRENYPVNAPAYGIMYISSFLKSNGFEIDTLNLNHYRNEKLEQVFSEKVYDVVLTGGLFTHLTKFKDIFSLAKRYNKNMKTVLGGPVATAHPEFAMQLLAADFLVLGEGEQTSMDLLNAIGGKTPLKDVRGIAFSENGRFIQAEPNQPVKDLDKLQFPDYKGFEFGKYLEMPHFRLQDNVSYLMKNMRPGYIVGGRDCPGKCTFCFRLTGGDFRLRSIDNIISEIKYLVDQYGVNDIGLMDDLFSIRKSRVYEFCEKIKPFNMTWQCQLRVPGVNEDLLTTMKDAGCYLVSYGFESASNTVLRSMKKGIRVKQIENVIPITREAKMTMQANFIFGDPAETLETANETLAFARRHRSFQINLSFIKPYPGSPLYHDLLKKGAIKNLIHFWIHSTKNEDGSLMNLTSLNAIEFMLLKARVSLQDAQKVYYKVKKIKKISEKQFLITMVCPVCRSELKDVHLVNPGLVACSKCYQRSWIDSFDILYKNLIHKQASKLFRYFALLAAGLILNNRSIGLFSMRILDSLENNRFLLRSKKYLLRL